VRGLAADVWIAGAAARRGPGDHRQVGGPDLGLAEDAPRRGPLALAGLDSTPDRRANSPMCSSTAAAAWSRRPRRPGELDAAASFDNAQISELVERTLRLVR
jgi:hypothetical protein